MTHSPHAKAWGFFDKRHPLKSFPKRVGLRPKLLSGVSRKERNPTASNPSDLTFNYDIKQGDVKHPDGQTSLDKFTGGDS